MLYFQIKNIAEEVKVVIQWIVLKSLDGMEKSSMIRLLTIIYL